ncbi:MAG TPA: transcriptional regulator, partial [Ideonella sp.]|nr:transcriptional regulator [Ideonella sp.]
GRSPQPFVPNTPSRLRQARSCYDHLAGALAVGLHDAWFERGWLVAAAEPGGRRYEVTVEGDSALAKLGIAVQPLRGLRRRFACACLDWSERRPHLGGALGAALLALALQRRWLQRELDSRQLRVTPLGRRELASRFGVSLA